MQTYLNVAKLVFVHSIMKYMLLYFSWLCSLFYFHVCLILNRKMLVLEILIFLNQIKIEFLFLFCMTKDTNNQIQRRVVVILKYKHRRQHQRQHSTQRNNNFRFPIILVSLGVII